MSMHSCVRSEYFRKFLRFSFVGVFSGTSVIWIFKSNRNCVKHFTCLQITVLLSRRRAAAATTAATRASTRPPTHTDSTAAPRTRQGRRAVPTRTAGARTPPPSTRGPRASRAPAPNRPRRLVLIKKISILNFQFQNFSILTNYYQLSVANLGTNFLRAQNFSETHERVGGYKLAKLTNLLLNFKRFY